MRSHRVLIPEIQLPALRLIELWLGCFIAVAPGLALAETCDERNESCIETCKIDHGMATDRKLLTRCLSKCEEKLEDCRDLRREERSRRRDDWEAPPQERKHSIDVSVGHEEQGSGEGRQRIEDSFDRAETRTDDRQSDSDARHGGIEDFGTTQGSDRQDNPPQDSEARSEAPPDPYRIDSGKDEAQPPPSSERSEPPEIPPDSQGDSDDWTGE